MKIAKLLFPLVGLALSAPAGAVSWNTASNSIGATTGSIYCSTTTCATSTSGLSGSIMTMTAYSTPNSGSPTPESGNWVDARIAIYSGGGVGISNFQQTGETSSPQHGIDNYLVNDLLVIDFGSNGWDVSSFSLGWTCTVSGPTSCSGSSVNVDAWVGGTGVIDFNTVSFSGSSSSATLPGFTSLTLSGDPGGTGVKTDSSSAIGRYLVIGGNLANSTSAFKVSGVRAIGPSAPPPTGVPLPGTAWLMVLGMLALATASRRARTPESRVAC